MLHVRAVMIWWLLLNGCAAFPIQEPAGDRAENTVPITPVTGTSIDSFKPRVRLVVPFFPDNTDQCGPATLASMLTFWGIPSDPRTLRDEIYLRRIRGTLSIDLLLAAQSRGLQAEGIGGTLHQLKTELTADRPVVVLLNLGWALYPQGHYVVVTGYDEQLRGVYVHSGLARDAFVPYHLFLDKWEKASRWMLRMRPAHQHANAHE